MFEELLGKQRYASDDDIRGVFGDYHNVLHWLALFLVGDEQTAQACIVDACKIADSPAPMFQEWLVKWAAVATVRYTLQSEYKHIAEFAPQYENGTPVEDPCPPLSAEQVRSLAANSNAIFARLDVLCRYVLVLRGLAKHSLEELSQTLRISRSAAVKAYCVAYDALNSTT